MSCKVKIQCSSFNPLNKGFAFQRTFLRVKRSCLETCTTPCLHTGWCACQRGRDVQAWTTCGSALHTGPAEHGNLGSQSVNTAISSTIQVYFVIRLDIKREYFIRIEISPKLLDIGLFLFHTETLYFFRAMVACQPRSHKKAWDYKLWKEKKTQAWKLYSPLCTYMFLKDCFHLAENIAIYSCLH